MKNYLTVCFICFLVLAKPASADVHLDFTLHKLESDRPGNTLLVVGGIQGDEPGGFNAASLLVTHYKILKGNVWVVPNLNFISIIHRTRGVYGDLNRKFATLPKTDPEHKTIRKIKEIILDDQVDMVLNLHDGSGFYRPYYLDELHNPTRWGQSVIIDQERIQAGNFGNLGEIARLVVADVNRQLFAEEHVYHVKNTRTRMGNEEMSRTLTYFAIQNSKSAFGLEVSKTFPTHERAYYHLCLLETYMNLLGIEYERRFELSATGIESAIYNNARVALYDNKIVLDVANARNMLRYIPLKKAAQIAYRPSNPLLAIVADGKRYRIYHGNRRLTRLDPEYFDYDSSIDNITMRIDGVETEAEFGELLEVKNSFLVRPIRDYRVNVIGFKKKGTGDESGLTIRADDIQKRFSVDKTGHIFRVEVYREDKFSGMVLVKFSEKGADLMASNPNHVPPEPPAEITATPSR